MRIVLLAVARGGNQGNQTLMAGFRTVEEGLKRSIDEQSVPPDDLIRPHYDLYQMS